MNEIKVTVVDYGRRFLMLRYVDPLTGKQKSKSAKTARQSEAVKAAGKWEAELREGRYHEPSKTLWGEFRDRYQDEVLASLADETDRKARGVFRMLESLCPVKRLVDLTGDRLSGYQSKLRELGKSESTIKGHLSHLKAALRWAVRVGLLAKAPSVQMPKRAKSSKGSDPMKGRPITLEEFERMLAKVEAGLTLAAKRAKGKVKRERKRQLTEKQATLIRQRHERLAATAAASWRHYLRGLWLSGLRLGESLALSWEENSGLCVSLTSKYPMLLIPAETEKGNRDRVLPMAPDFAQWLLETPESERAGFVFNPLTRMGDRAGADLAMRTVAAIGEAAGVKVRTDGDKVKFASAHDLRRSFGERWASKVMPQVLMELMRHESIDTTLRYYVGRNAETTAAVLWTAFGNTPGNSGPSERQAETSKVVSHNAL